MSRAIPRPKRHRLRLHRARVISRGPCTLTIALDRGGHERVLDEHGCHVASYNDQALELRGEVGDQLVIMGPTIEETACYEIARVDVASMLARFLCGGALAASTDQAWILPGPKGKRKAAS